MLIALTLAALFAADDPDAIVTTAPKGAGSVVVGAELPTTDAQPSAAQLTAVTPHDLTTQEQIDRWVAARATEAEPFASDRVTGGDDREMHGFVSAAVGSNDFRSVAVGVSMPVGENGRLDLAYSEVKNGWSNYGYGRPDEYGYGYGRSYGRGHGLGEYGHSGSPILGYEPMFGTRARSGRSVSLGFSLNDDDRRDRRPNRASSLVSPDRD